MNRKFGILAIFVLTIAISNLNAGGARGLKFSLAEHELEDFSAESLGATITPGIVVGKGSKMEFQVPSGAGARFDQWYAKYFKLLNPVTWNDAGKVPDSLVVEVKKSLGTFLNAADPDSFAKKITIGINAQGVIKVQFKSSGQILTYTPGK